MDGGAVTAGRMRRKLLRHAAWLVVAAALFAAVGATIYLGISSPPYGAALELTAGAEHHGEFQARWDADYRIRMDTDRGLDVSEQRCLLGLPALAGGACDGIAPELVLTWQVDQGQEAVAAGTALGGRAVERGPGLGKVIGRFPGLRGSLYRVTVTTKRTSPKLNRVNPRLTVEVHPKDLKWTYVWIGLCAEIAAVVFLLAALLFVIALSRRDQVGS